MHENQRLQYLEAMGITTWVRHCLDMESIADQQQHDISESFATPSPAAQSSATTWEALQQCVANCTACPLHQGRTQTVFGVGNQNADLLIVGEAPGFHEDQQGEPFVGRAGMLLNEMLMAIGLRREEIFIANILKCRPPNNRDPSPEEVATCTPFLEQQVAMLQPKMIMAVGRIAAHYLLKTDLSMAKLRGQRYHFRETSIPLIVTYHPAYLLRSPQDKAKAYMDLLLVRQILEAQ